MTDEQMDARLRAAGQRWRTATAVVEQEQAPALEHVRPLAATRHRRWPLLASAAVIAAALVVGGTLLLRGGADTPRPSGDVAGLQGHVWLLTARPGTHSTAVLYIDKNGALVADDECRLVGAQAKVDGSTLTVTGAVTRDKPCTDQYQPGFFNGAQAFLTGTSRFRITSDALTIAKNGVLDRFVPAPQNTPVPALDFPTLTGVQWELTDATNTTGVLAPVAAGQTLRLDQGKVSGSIGCARFGAPATISGSVVTIGTYFVPATSCANSPARSVLTGSVHASVQGAQLVLSKGAAKLVFRWLPASRTGHDPAQFENRTWYLADNAGSALPLGASFRVSGGRFTTSDPCERITGLSVQPGAYRADGVNGATTDPCSRRPPLDSLWTTTWTAWSIQDDRLMIFSGTQADPVVFTTTPPSGPPPSAALDGTWQFVLPGASMAVEEAFTIGSGTITITHRCYATRGSVAVTAGALAISGVHPYRSLPCPMQPRTVAATERIIDAHFDHLLAGKAVWTLKNNVLTVSAQGVRSMTFERGSGP